LLAELTDVLSDGVSQNLWLLSVGMVMMMKMMMMMTS